MTPDSLSSRVRCSISSAWGPFNQQQSQPICRFGAQAVALSYEEIQRKLVTITTLHVVLTIAERICFKRAGNQRNRMKEAYKELLQQAHRAKENAHAPYSGFKVGATLFTKDGKMIDGCNVENAAYGSTMCAERVAIYKAVSMG
jgi:hypothetical protein